VRHGAVSPRISLKGWGLPEVQGLGVRPGWGPFCAAFLLLCGGARGGPDHCPGKLTCLTQRRFNCAPGSNTCGPCLKDHQEKDGRCRQKFRHNAVHFAPNRFDPIIERDIDHLAALLAKQDSGSPTQDGNTTQSQPLQNGPPSGAAGRSGTPAGSTAMPRRGATKPANDALLLGVVVGCAIAGLVALVVAGIYWCRMHREMKLAQKVDYTSYKSSPPPPYEKTSPGDKKLAQSAQMYHYQHQKQQMISMEKNKDEPKHPDSALTSEDENEDGDFTVYECPGLAPTGEMEVKNPLFDDSTLHHPTHSAP
uniref:Neural proliferation differentiation and control protein 1 n=1 Tax=Xenopus tropicalis TaxID=8364 RepID=A0A803KAZ1_XENTR